MFFPKSFQNLLEISKQPHLRNHVKCLSYEGGILQSVDFDESWRRAALKYNRNLTPEQLRDGYNKYKEAISEREDFSNTRSDYAMLAEAFRNLPNLKAIDLEIGVADPCYSRAMEAAFGPTLVMPGVLPYWPSYSERFPFRSGNLELASLLFALASAGTKLEDLTLKNLGFGVLDNFSRYEELLPSIFLNLKHLSLSFDPPNSWYPDSQPLHHRQAVLGKALRLAEGLESLHLDCRYDRYGWCKEPWKRDGLRVAFERLAGKMTWPRLQYLSLSTLDTDEDFFFDFMWRHASSLKSLHLENLRLTRGTWEATFRKMQACLRLQQCGIASDPFVNGNSEEGGGPELVIMGSYLGRGHVQILGDKKPLREKIEDFFLRGGVDPFLDKAALEPTDVHLPSCAKVCFGAPDCDCDNDSGEEYRGEDW